MLRRALVAAIVAATVEGAAAGVSVIPIPEILTDPNEGNTYGFLPVILLLDREERIEAIAAHDVRWNRITGFYPAFRLLGYPTVRNRYSIILRKSQRIDESYEALYEHEGLRGGRLDVGASVEYRRDSRRRFYGFGNDSDDEAESNYTRRMGSFRASVRYRPHWDWVVGWALRYEDSSITRGGVDDLPTVDEVFPGVAGLDGARVHGHRFSLARDTRDSLTMTRSGTLIEAWIEIVDRGLGSTESFLRWGAEGRHFVPVHDRVTVATRANLLYLEARAGEVPFFERARLGGSRSLRGFGNDRFTDDNAAHASVELRTMAWRQRIFGVLAELEIAPFADVGQVFAERSQLPVEDPHLVGGVAFRGVVRPQVVGFVDVGWGSEGMAIFTGLDYPF